jgi:hypothetical protein
MKLGILYDENIKQEEAQEDQYMFGKKPLHHMYMDAMKNEDTEHIISAMNIELIAPATEALQDLMIVKSCLDPRAKTRMWRCRMKDAKQSLQVQETDCKSLDDVEKEENSVTDGFVHGQKRSVYPIGSLVAKHGFCIPCGTEAGAYMEQCMPHVYPKEKAGRILLGAYAACKVASHFSHDHHGSTHFLEDVESPLLLQGLEIVCQAIESHMHTRKKLRMEYHNKIHGKPDQACEDFGKPDQACEDFEPLSYQDFEMDAESSDPSNQQFNRAHEDIHSIDASICIEKDGVKSTAQIHKVMDMGYWGSPSADACSQGVACRKNKDMGKHVFMYAIQIVCEDNLPNYSCCTYNAHEGMEECSEDEEHKKMSAECKSKFAKPVYIFAFCHSNHVKPFAVTGMQNMFRNHAWRNVLSGRETSHGLQSRYKSTCNYDGACNHPERRLFSPHVSYSVLQDKQVFDECKDFMENMSTAFFAPAHASEDRHSVRYDAKQVFASQICMIHQLCAMFPRELGSHRKMLRLIVLQGFQREFCSAPLHKESKTRTDDICFMTHLLNKTKREINPFWWTVPYM